MENLKDPLTGKVDIDEAPVDLVVNEGLTMQEKSKQSLYRMQDKLTDAEQLAVESKLELQKQNERLMKIDEQL